MSEKTDIWMPLYISDYLKDTRHLSTLEHGAYLLILMAYWNNQGPLPDDDVRLARYAGLSLKQWKKIRPAIIELFQTGDGRINSRRSQEELDNANRRSQAARANVMKRYNSDSTPVPTPVPTEPPTDELRNGYSSPSPSPSPGNHHKSYTGLRAKNGNGHLQPGQITKRILGAMEMGESKDARRLVIAWQMELTEAENEELALYETPISRVCDLVMKAKQSLNFREVGA